MSSAGRGATKESSSWDAAMRTRPGISIHASGSSFEAAVVTNEPNSLRIYSRVRFQVRQGRPQCSMTWRARAIAALRGKGNPT